MLKCWFYAVLLAAALLLPVWPTGAELAKSTVLESNVGYVRVAQTETNLPDEIQSALDAFAASTNKIAGIVLDLRFAGGTDASGVKATEGVLEGQKLPLAILVNAQTTGAAASLAYDLRSADAGLVFGAHAPDSQPNWQPDVVISASTNDEQQFLEDPYGTFTYTNSGADTNLLDMVDIDHTSEADLVREKIKDGEQDSSTAVLPDGTAEAPKRYLRDPVLAHGVDFIKGLAALRLNKS